uniref:centrosomal protein of 44 kDa-like n=1 Tax=Styela clava TaxID=7725 RepID=UPI001939B22B|nr:centrosomal protein of 44 kDa-like [Styela clava]
MATGDIRNNLKKLQKQVSFVQYPDELDFEGLSKGDVSAHLPILYHAFFNFNSRVVENITKLNYSLAGKRDSAFVNVIFKIMREHNPKCNLTLKIGQFMSKGFAERKIILTKEILEFVRTSPKLAANDGKPKPRAKTAVSVAAMVGASGISNANMKVPDVSSIASSQEATLVHSSHLQSSSHSILSTAPIMQSTARSVTRCKTVPTINYVSEMEILHSVSHEDEPQSFRSTVVCHASDNIQNNGRVGESDNVEYESKEIYFRDEINELQERLKTLEKVVRENSKLKSELEEVKMENLKLKKEQTILKKDFEIFIGQKQQIPSNNIVARLDIIDSKISVIENKQADLQTPPSPVCGDNLCSHMQKMHLQNNESFLNTSQVTEKSLLDVTNDSPAVDTRQKSMKLLQLVQGTRTLLGLSDMSGLNQSTDKVDENSPPKE